MKRISVVLLVCLVVRGSMAWTVPKLEKVRLSEVVRSVYTIYGDRRSL